MVGHIEMHQIRGGVPPIAPGIVGLEQCRIKGEVPPIIVGHRRAAGSVHKEGSYGHSARGRLVRVTVRQISVISPTPQKSGYYNAEHQNARMSSNLGMAITTLVRAKVMRRPRATQKD